MKEFNVGIDCKDNKDNGNSFQSLIESASNVIFTKNQLLRIDDVSKLTTLAKSTINVWESTQRFPKSISLSPTIKVWTLESIVRWLEKAKT